LIDASGRGYGQMKGSSEHNNEHSNSIKGEEFVDFVTVIFSRRTLIEVVS